MTRYRIIDSPIGELTLIADGDRLVEILFANQPYDDATGPPHTGADPVLDATQQQLGEYFAGTRTRFDLPVGFTRGTEFQQHCWQALGTIAYGDTISYRGQAEAIGRPTATRAVGAANGKNPLPIVLPCHRVVGADGSLTGFGGGIETKRWLLDHESQQSSLPGM